MNRGARGTKHQARSTRHEAPSTRHASLVWLLPLAAVIFAVNFGRQLCGDVFWHLKAGEWIVAHKAFPFHDPFSYTATHTWILQEWAFQILAYLVSRASLSLLAVLAFLTVATAIVISYRTSLGRATAPAAFLAAVIVSGLCADMVDCRAQVVGLLALAILVWSIERSARAERALSLWLIPFFALWANFHSSFTAGLALLALECAGSLYTAIRSKAGFSLPMRNVIVTAASVLAALVNPNGLRIYEFPIRTMAHRGMTSTIAEWTPPHLRSIVGISLALAVLLLAIGLIRRDSRRRPADVMRLAAFLVAALMARRFDPIFGLACAPILAGLISAPVSRIVAAPRRASAIVLVVAVLAVGGVVWRARDIGGRSAFDYITMTEMFPSEACDFLLSERPPGPVFNELNYGSYLIWRLWPKYKVFVDNRNDIFYGGAFEDFMRAVNASDDSSWRPIFDRYGIRLAVLQPCPLADSLRTAPDWQLIYEDDRTLIYQRIGPRPDSPSLP